MSQLKSFLIVPFFAFVSLCMADAATHCDDLIENLCSLDYHKGEINVGNDTLVYFIYSKPTEIAFLNNKPVFANIPLIGINGGPGVSHAYLEPLKKLACLGTPIILYYRELNQSH